MYYTHTCISYSYSIIMNDYIIIKGQKFNSEHRLKQILMLAFSSMLIQKKYIYNQSFIKTLSLQLSFITFLVSYHDKTSQPTVENSFHQVIIVHDIHINLIGKFYFLKLCKMTI